jgi:hypothetical protein
MAITIALVFAPHAVQANAFQLLAVLEEDERPWPAFQMDSYQGAVQVRLVTN